MSEVRVSYTAPSSDEWVPPAHSVQALMLSTGAPWSDILKVEKHRVSRGEIPEFCAPEHRIALRLGPPGVVEMRIAGDRAHRTLPQPGDFCLFSAGVPIAGTHHRETEFLSVALAPSFVATVADRTAAAWHRVEFTNPCSVRDPIVQHLMLALEADLQAGCPAGRLYGEGLATALTVHLLRHYAVVPFRLVAPGGGLPPVRLRRVLDYVAAHLDADTSLHRLAELASMSPHHFATLFKASTGLTPHQYVLRQKIARAKELLADYRTSLAEISYALGFASQAHFTTMFRKLVGTTPGAFRERR